MKIGLIDYDGKLPNLALMKLSTSHKLRGDEVVLNPPSPAGLDKTYVSLIFSWSKEDAIVRYGDWPGAEFGGTGFSLQTTLPDDIEALAPDFDLYTTASIYARINRRISRKENSWHKAQEIVDAGIGFFTRGCVNTEKTCPWCAVPVKEKAFRRVTTKISDLLNPRSNRLILLDNSPLAHPDALELLKEIKERKLIVDITQGFDIRRLTPELAVALAKIRHWRSLHYSWDIVKGEQAVFNGIRILSEFIAKSRQMCYLLCGFNTSFEEDMERIVKLRENGIRPYVMIYRPLDGFKNPAAKTDYAKVRLQHLKRWVNAPKALYKTVPFSRYENWVKAQEKLLGAIGAMQMNLGFV